MSTKRKPATKRVRSLSTRVTPEEYAQCLARADAQHISISEWARRTIEAAVVEREFELTLLEELWALKFTLLNGLPQLAPDPATQTAAYERFKHLVTEADQRKAEKARRLLGDS